jgi:hypothetical protein
LASAGSDRKCVDPEFGDAGVRLNSQTQDDVARGDRAELSLFA